MDRNKKAREEITNKMRRGCMWPMCQHPSTEHKTSVQKLEVKEGKVLPAKEQTVQIYLCPYHQLLAVRGMMMASESDGKGNHQLSGPFDAVRVAEEVFQAMIYSHRFESMLQDRNNKEKEINNKMNDLMKRIKERKQDENKGKNKEQEGNKHVDTDGDKQCVEVQQRKSGNTQPQDN